MLPVYVKPAQPQHHSGEEQEPAGEEHRGGDHSFSSKHFSFGKDGLFLVFPLSCQAMLRAGIRVSYVFLFCRFCGLAFTIARVSSGNNGTVGRPLIMLMACAPGRLI